MNATPTNGPTLNESLLRANAIRQQAEQQSQERATRAAMARLKPVLDKLVASVESLQARVGSLEQQLRAATSRDDSPLEEVTK